MRDGTVVEPVTAEGVPSSESREAVDASALFVLAPTVGSVVVAEAMFWVTKGGRPMLSLSRPLTPHERDLVLEWEDAVNGRGVPMVTEPVAGDGPALTPGPSPSAEGEGSSEDDEQRPVSRVATEQTHITEPVEGVPSSQFPEASEAVADCEACGAAAVGVGHKLVCPGPSAPSNHAGYPARKASRQTFAFDIRMKDGMWWLECPVHGKREGEHVASPDQRTPALVACPMRNAEPGCETWLTLNGAMRAAKVGQGGAV